MFYEFKLAVPALTSQSDPVSVVMPLTEGIIHRFEVQGDWGEHNLVSVSIRRAVHQVFPSNPSGVIHPGFFPVGGATWYELEEEPFQLEAYAWSDDDTYAHTALIRIWLERREVLEPGRETLSFLGKLRSMLFGG